MRVIRRTATRTIRVQCPCRSAIGQDERLLLDILALAQSGEGFDARFLLRSMISAPGVDEAHAIAVDLARLFQEAGCRLDASERSPVAQFGLAGVQTR